MIRRIESCGLMVTVGYWVLEESCRQLAARQQQGITLPLSVNLCATTDAPDHGAGDARVDPPLPHSAPHVDPEVTESRCIDNPDDAVAILKPLRNAGIRIALDDFGMGYSGLRQLQHMKTLPVDVLKIDKTFVEGLPEDCSPVQAIIQMAHSLNLHVIAEGIETDAQREWLAAAGVEADRASCLTAPYRRISLSNAISPTLAITQKCNFVAGLCEPAQSS